MKKFNCEIIFSAQSEEEAIEKVIALVMQAPFDCRAIFSTQEEKETQEPNNDSMKASGENEPQENAKIKDELKKILNGMYRKVSTMLEGIKGDKEIIDGFSSLLQSVFKTSKNKTTNP